MEKKIRVKTFDGSCFELEPDSSATMARLLFLNGVFRNVPLCSGMGRCGLCKIRYDSEAPDAQKEELLKLGPDEIERGWRFSCLHDSLSADIFIPRPEKTVPPRKSSVCKVESPHLKLAVDLGTTSIHWALLDKYREIATGQELNPQTGLGSEIMSRLAFASSEENRAVLSTLILNRLKEIISEAPAKVEEMVISGNSSMLSILIQDDLKGLSRAPYTLPRQGGEIIELDAELPPAYMPTHLAPFVGADLTAGLAALRFGPEKPDPPYLLADLGTNGEFVLCTGEDNFLVTSVPMGPALEGVGLSCGMTAGPGAISSFSLSPAGLVPGFAGPPEKGKSTGITGTGYISLCALLLKSGVLAPDGSFSKGRTPLASKLANTIIQVQNSPALVLGPDMMLPAADIEEILKVKAAFNLAASALLNKSGLPPSSLKSILLAGAMGQYVNVNDLVTTGFLPPEAGPLTRAVGNTSLEGSKVLAGNSDARDYVKSLPRKTSIIDLAGGEDFGQKFLERMIFNYVY